MIYFWRPSLGGLGLGFLQEEGLEWPHRVKGRIKLGFLDDVFIGAVAAIIFYAINPPSAPTRLVASTITAGPSGSAILKGYVNSAIEAARVTKMVELANSYKETAYMAMTGAMEAAQKRMDELENMEKQIKEQ
jgi:hypothetical protein